MFVALITSDISSYGLLRLIELIFYFAFFTSLAVSVISINLTVFEEYLLNISFYVSSSLSRRINCSRILSYGVFSNRDFVARVFNIDKKSCLDSLNSWFRLLKRYRWKTYLHSFSYFDRKN